MDLNIDLPLFAAAKINNNDEAEEESGYEGKPALPDSDEAWSDGADPDEEEDLYDSSGMFDEE